MTTAPTASDSDRPLLIPYSTAAKMLAISIRSVRRLCDAGELARVQLPSHGRPRVSRRSVEELVERGTQRREDLPAERRRERDRRRKRAKYRSRAAPFDAETGPSPGDEPRDDSPSSASHTDSEPASLGAVV